MPRTGAHHETWPSTEVREPEGQNPAGSEVVWEVTRTLCTGRESRTRRLRISHDSLRTHSPTNRKRPKLRGEAWGNRGTRRRRTVNGVTQDHRQKNYPTGRSDIWRRLFPDKTSGRPETDWYRTDRVSSCLCVCVYVHIKKFQLLINSQLLIVTFMSSVVRPPSEKKTSHVSHTHFLVKLH